MESTDTTTNPAIEPLTCLTCRVLFPCENSDVKKMIDTHKAHYQSDWHRFNLNRKIAELPPVSFDVFNDRVLTKRNEAQHLETLPLSWYCEICKKKFTSSKTFDDHQKSSKHKLAEKSQTTKSSVELNVLMMNKKNLRKSQLPIKKPKKKCDCYYHHYQDDGDDEDGDDEDGDEDLEEEEVSDEEWNDDPLPVNVCLFCSYVSKGMDENVEHMNKAHSFYIPDIEFVSDLHGLMTYLGEKVGSYHVCLWCNDSRFRADVRAVQQHMLDKGHNMMCFEKQGLLEYSDFYDYRKSYPDYKENDNDEDDDGDDDEVDLTRLNLDDHNFQLKLPSGVTIGHRSLLRYYKQKLNPDRQLVLHNNSSSISKAIENYKRLGWTGTTGSAALVRAKDIAYVNKFKAKHFMKIGIKSNKLQKHYRDQTFGY